MNIVRLIEEFPNNPQAVDPETDLNTELSVLDSSKYNSNAQQNDSDSAAENNQESLGQQSQLNEAFPETEFQKFRKQRATEFLFDWVGNSLSQKFTSAFYLLWDNVQHSKLSRLAQRVRSRKLGILGQCMKAIKRARQPPSTSAAKSDKVSIDRIQRRFPKFKEGKFKFTNFYAKYKTADSSRTESIPTQTSIDGRPSLRTLLRKQKRRSVRAGKLGLFRSKRPKLSVNNAPFHGKNPKRRTTGLEAKSDQMLLFRSANRHSRCSRNSISDEITDGQLNATNLSFYKKFRASKLRIAKDKPSSFIMNSFVNIRFSHREIRTSRSQNEQSRNFENLSKLVLNLSSRNVGTALAKLRANLQTGDCGLEVVETRDFSRQMNRIADFSQAIADKCRLLERDKASFSEDKSDLLAEINRLVFYVKNNLLRLEQRNRLSDEGADSLESPLLSRAESDKRNTDCSDFFRKKSHQPKERRTLASTRNSSAVNYSPNDVQPKSPCIPVSGKMQSLGSINLLKSDFWDAAESNGQNRSLGISRTIEDDVKFEAQRSLRKTVPAEASKT